MSIDTLIEEFLTEASGVSWKEPWRGGATHRAATPEALLKQIEDARADNDRDMLRLGSEIRGLKESIPKSEERLAHLDAQIKAAKIQLAVDRRRFKVAVKEEDAIYDRSYELGVKIDELRGM